MTIDPKESESGIWTLIQISNFLLFSTHSAKYFYGDVQKSACYINESSIGARGRLQQSDHKGVISAGTDKSQKMVVFDLISIAVFTRDDENH